MERPYRYRPILFFAVAFIVTWVPWLIAGWLAADPARQASALPVGYLGLFGPMIVTLVFIVTSGSKALKADFRSRFNPRRIRPLYLGLAIVLPAIAMYLGIWLSLLFGQSADQFQISRDADLLRMVIIAMIVAPIVEEISWRGYGVDSLRSKLGMLGSTLLFGVLWSLWHAPLIRLPGTYQHEVAVMGNPLFLANFFISAIPAAILTNWLYYRNERSILIGVLFHGVSNAAAEMLSAGQVAKCIVTVLWVIVAVVAIVLDRKTFGAGPRNFVTAHEAG